MAESLVAAGRRKPSTAVRWRRLLTDVLEQRSNKGFTPLMVACRNGHALVAAYLLREGADPLAADGANLRTALHYAASGGHVDCLRLLCSETTLVATQQGARPLRNVLVQDLTVQSCRYIDQRAYGGLTALHFAVVTGQLDAVLALLQAGASIMVKTGRSGLAGVKRLADLWIKQVQSQPFQAHCCMIPLVPLCRRRGLPGRRIPCAWVHAASHRCHDQFCVDRTRVAAGGRRKGPDKLRLYRGRAIFLRAASFSLPATCHA